MTADQLIHAAMARSVEKKLSVTVIPPTTGPEADLYVGHEGETSTLYFATQARYDSFVARATRLGYTICAS